MSKVKTLLEELRQTEYELRLKKSVLAGKTAPMRDLYSRLSDTQKDIIYERMTEMVQVGVRHDKIKIKKLAKELNEEVNP